MNQIIYCLLICWIYLFILFFSISENWYWWLTPSEISIKHIASWFDFVNIVQHLAIILLFWWVGKMQMRLKELFFINNKKTVLTSVLMEINNCLLTLAVSHTPTLSTFLSSALILFPFWWEGHSLKPGQNGGEIKNESNK